MKIECTPIEKHKLMESIQFSKWCPFGDDTCTESECYTCLSKNITWKVIQEEQFEWCKDCKEYDKKNHCCHRWSQQISNTIKELKNSYHNDGEWVFIENTVAVECSRCFTRYVKSEAMSYNYCPNCGAKIKKG